MLEFFGTAGIFGSTIDAVGVGANRTEDPEAWCLGVTLTTPVRWMLGHQPKEKEESETGKSMQEC